MSDLLNLNEAAYLVGKTPKALTYRIRQGALPAVLVTTHGEKQRYMVAEADVLAVPWLHSSPRGPRPKKPKPPRATLPVMLREESRRSVTMPQLVGACHGMDVNFFFSDHESGQRRAKEVCATCPVIEECRSWAISRETWGVFGGMTSRERTQWRREHGITVTGSMSVTL